MCGVQAAAALPPAAVCAGKLSLTSELLLVQWLCV